MNYEEWSKKAEDNNSLLSNEYFNMQVGLTYSEEKIHELEKKSEELAVYFLKNWKEPEEVYSSCVGAISSARTVKSLLKLHDLRKTEIISSKHKFKSQPVNWGTWRQFVVNAEDKARKEVFDEFIQLTTKISPLIKDRFEKSAEIFEEYNLDPLKDYLMEHKISLENLKEFLVDLRDGVKKRYLEVFSETTQKLLKREPKYYDDLYFMRNVIYNDLVNKFKNINPMNHVKKTFVKLNLDPSKIIVDEIDRPNKYPSPFCSMVRIPTDIRVSYKAENPLNDIKSVYHEMGHAIHGTYIKSDLPYENRCLHSMGLAETFSTFFESLASNKLYLMEELNLSEELADQYINRSKTIKFITLAFYAGNSLFKMRMWNEKIPFEKLNDIYHQEIKKSMNLEIPGEYWQLHHILPESLMYVPSYLLAYANVCEMKEKCEELGGKRWWNNKKAGEYILNVMELGNKSPLADFSKIKPDKLIKGMNNF
ncbi:hypothetical protein HY837_04645 [archaeon]|nr:hypothetical protein [archaeon]